MWFCGDLRKKAQVNLKFPNFCIKFEKKRKNEGHVVIEWKTLITVKWTDKQNTSDMLVHVLHMFTNDNNITVTLHAKYKNLVSHHLRWNTSGAKHTTCLFLTKEPAVIDVFFTKQMSYNICELETIFMSKNGHLDHCRIFKIHFHVFLKTWNYELRGFSPSLISECSLPWSDKMPTCKHTQCNICSPTKPQPSYSPLLHGVCVYI